MFPLVVLMLLALSGHPFSKVEFVGNSHFSDEELTRAFSLRPGDTARPESVRAAVQRVLGFYRDKGYIFATVELNRGLLTDSLRILAKVEEGPRYTLGYIALDGNEAFSDELVLSRMDTRAGQVFDQETFQRDMERVLSLYENSGYAFTQVLPERFYYDTVGHKIELGLRVIEGPKVRFAGVRVLGSKVSRQEYLIRESGVREGEIYSPLKLENARRRLERLPFMTEVGDFSLERGEAEDLIWAKVEVKEGRMNLIYGVLGIEPGEQGGLTGLVNVSLQNLTGRGRGLEARWHRTSPLSSRLHLAYMEPFLFSYDVALHVSFGHHIRDTSYTKSSVSVDLQSKSRGLLGSSLGFSFERVLPGSSPVSNSRSYGVRTGIWVDTRRSPRTNRGGVFYDLRAEYALRINAPSKLVKEPEPRANTGRLVFDFLHYVPSFLGHLVYAALHGREAYTSEPEVPVHDYFFLGGAASVRGYREEEFSGFRVAWADVEYRIVAGRGSYFYPFLDIGYYQAQKSGAILGYGLGLKVSSGLGSLGLDYGLAKGDGPLDGKLHVRLTGEF